MPMPSTEQDRIQEEGRGDVPDPTCFHVFLLTMSELNISRDFQRGKKTRARRGSHRTGCHRLKEASTGLCAQHW